MRISKDENDKAFGEIPEGTIVRLDGVDLVDWTMADDHLQAVIINGEIKRGNVEIVLGEIKRKIFGGKRG